MTFIAALLVLGASGLIAQIVLLRELLVVFSGNELAIGVVLGDWLVLEAGGCLLMGRALARRRGEAAAFVWTQLFFALALPASLAAARLLRTWTGVPAGEGFGLGVMLLAGLAVLAPVSAAHGALFAIAGRLRARRAPGPQAGGFVYGWETLGTLAGGLLLTGALLAQAHSFRIVWAASCVNALACLLVLAPSWREARTRRLGALCLGVFAFLALCPPGPEGLQRSTVRGQWPGQEVVFYGNSVYGNVAVLQTAEQYDFLVNGARAVTVPTPDVPAAEELAHLALLAHPSPQDVLVVGAGAGGLLAELLKHPVARLDYAELDPLLLAALARFSTPLTRAELQDPRVSVREEDGRLWVKKTGRLYDALIVGARRPANLEANRLFTREFFASARSRLKPGGLLAFSLPGSEAALDKNLARLNSCVLQTAQAVFRHVRPIPGDTNLFLASDSDAVSGLGAAELAGRLRLRRIRTGFVGPAQLAWRLEARRAQSFADSLAPWLSRAGLNTDFQPRAVLYDLANWNAMFSPFAGRLFSWAEALTPWRLAAALAVLLAGLLAWQRRGGARGLEAAAAIAATGAAGMVYNVGLAFAFQAVYGYVYLWIGVLVSVFMAGAGGASLLAGVIRPQTSAAARRSFIYLEAGLVLFSLGLPLMLRGLAGASVPDWVLQGSFLLLCLAAGGLTGAQFPLACRLQGQDPAALYTCDLLGGWLGGIVGGALLLPVLGLGGACLCVALLKLASLALNAAAAPTEARA